MLSGKGMIDIPIVMSGEQATGEHVYDWIFDNRNNQLIGFLVDPGGWLGGARVLAWENIKRVTPETVMVNLISPIIRLDHILAISQILKDDANITGLPLYTFHSNQLGNIADLYFDEITGTVLGYAVLESPFAPDTLNEFFVPAVEPLQLIDGTAFITDETILGLRVRQAVRTDDGFLVAATGQIITREVLDRAIAADKSRVLLEAVGLIGHD